MRVVWAISLMLCEASGLPAATNASPVSFSRLPLSFEENRGQTDGRAGFTSRQPGYSVLLAAEEAIFRLGGAGKSSELRMRFPGSKRAGQITGLDPLPGKSNYFIGHDPKNWKTSIPNYARVRYREVFQGIDLVFHGSRQALEYDFIVHPGADPGLIHLDLAGADKVALDEDGNLDIQVGSERLKMRKPVAYQESGGVRVEIAAAFRTRGTRVRFLIGRYDRNKTLVIDPVLAYSTYGARSVNSFFGYALAVDSAGSAYVFGATEDFGTGNTDCFLLKLNPTGTALAYTAMLGGHVREGCRAIAVDGSGSAYVTGHTESGDFPTTPGAYNTEQYDIFVSKLSPSGSSLVYSTYVGGNRDLGPRETGIAIAVDSGGNAYVAGTANSLDFPTTPGSFQTAAGGTALPGILDGFVLKLNPSGSNLVYSTRLAGSNQEEATALAIDLAGNAYVTGFTLSADFPTTPGAYQTSFSGAGSSFVAKINPTGSALLYSTFFGGDREAILGVAVSIAGQAYLTGTTGAASMSSFPATPGAFQTTYRGNTDAFAAQLNAAGSGLVYATFLGGSGTDIASGIALDAAGNAYIAGLTDSSDYPTVSSFHPYAGARDIFVTKLNPMGTSLAYSTYLGGTASDGEFGPTSTSISVDAAGNAFVAGVTQSLDFPGTPGAFRTVLSNSPEVVVAKIAASLVSFAGIQAFAAIDLRNQGFAVSGTFTLGAASNGIAPLTESLRLRVGTFMTTIPTGSFRPNGFGGFQFRGVINGASLIAALQPLGGQRWGFSVVGWNANVSGTANPVTAQFTVGDDEGGAAVNAVFGFIPRGSL